MHHFFVPEDNLLDGRIIIRGDDVNHIRNVLRMTLGEKLAISCGKGVEYICAVEELQEDAVTARILEEHATESELPVSITLFQSLPKSDKMEFVIQKAIELGVSRVVPMRTKRCVVKLDERKEQKKLARWQAIAEAAAKQSGRGMIPEIERIADFEQALQMAAQCDTLLIPYELCDNMPESVTAVQRAAEGKSVGIFIGPEGGFERGEVEQAVNGGSVAISLGKRILRTETAGLAVLSVLMFLIEGKNKN